MQVELKHSLAVRRSSWFIRLYQFVWCDTARIRAADHQITFCSLFWGYAFMPIGLLLVPLYYGGIALFNLMRFVALVAAVLIAGAGRLVAGTGTLAHAVVEVIPERPKREIASEDDPPLFGRAAERRQREALVLERKSCEEEVRYLLGVYHNSSITRQMIESGRPSRRTERLLKILAEIEEEDRRKAERIEKWARRRKLWVTPAVAIRRPLLNAISFGFAKAIMLTDGLGARTAQGIIAMYRVSSATWRRARWPVLVLVSLSALVGVAFGLYLLTPSIIWLAVATVQSLGWFFVHTALAIAWLAVNTFWSLLWFVVTTFWSLIWFFVHTALAIAWFFAAGIPGAASAIAYGIATAAAASWFWVLLGIGGVIIGAIVFAFLIGVVGHLAGPACRGVARTIGGAVGGVRMFGQAMQIGYVAVKSNTCPKIVLKNDDE